MKETQRIIKRLDDIIDEIGTLASIAIEIYHNLENESHSAMKREVRKLENKAFRIQYHVVRAQSTLIGRFIDENDFFD